MEWLHVLLLWNVIENSIYSTFPEQETELFVVKNIFDEIHETIIQQPLEFTL